MELFAQFIQERVYLKGVSPKTVISYQCAFKAFAGATETKTTMMQRIAELRERASARFRSTATSGTSKHTFDGWKRKAM